MSEEDKEIEEAQTEIKRLEEGDYKDCEICNHPESDYATELYLKEEREVKPVKTWFKKKFKLSFKTEDLKEHFDNHIDPDITEYSLIRKREIKDLVKKTYSPTEKSSDKITLTQQILWDRMIDVQVSRKESLESREDKNMHINQSKELCALAKTFRENRQMQLEVLGMGKSEEEQKKLMSDFAANLINNLIATFDDMPEAQERLSEFLNVKLGDKDEDEDSGEFIKEEL